MTFRRGIRWLIPAGLLLLIPVLASTTDLLRYSKGAPSHPLPALSRAAVLPVRFRSWPEHDAVRARYGEPYVLEVESGRGALLYYGAKHGADPIQSRDIARRWTSFRPTVALCEGRARGFLVGALVDLLGRGHTDPMTVHRLARRNRVPLFTLEPSYENEVAQLLEKWSPDRLALYYTTRVYWSEAGGRPDESLALDLLRKRTDVTGLRGALSTIEDLDGLWRRDFAGQGDWRSTREEPSGTYLSLISEDSREARGQHMVRVLLHLVRKGERVLAVVGSGHVIRQEWVLRASFGAGPAPDQPREVIHSTLQ